jgi:hypothetical protein
MGRSSARRGRAGGPYVTARRGDGTRIFSPVFCDSDETLGLVEVALLVLGVGQLHRLRPAESRVGLGGRLGLGRVEISLQDLVRGSFLRRN